MPLTRQPVCSFCARDSFAVVRSLDDNGRVPLKKEVHVMGNLESRQHGTTAYVPGRICLAGEGLDWMVGGPSLVAGIGLYTKASFLPHASPNGILLSSREPLFIRRSVGLADLETYTGDELDLLQATVNVAPKRMFGFSSGRLQVATQLPVAAGLASSAAVTLAAYAALADAHGAWSGREDACIAAHEAENEEIRVRSGWMDFLGCAYGGVSLIEASTPHPGTDSRTV